jgi:hypothetical protein
MKLFKWGDKKNDDDLYRLESILDNALKPVKPSQDYVRRLRYQIVSQYEPIRDEVKAQQHRTVLLVGASLVGGLLTLAMGIRIVMTLVAGVAMLLQWKKSQPPERAMVARQIN